MKRSYGTLIVLATLLLAARVAAQDPPAAPDLRNSGLGFTVEGQAASPSPRSQG
jgi:hypothetical protein